MTTDRRRITTIVFAAAIVLIVVGLILLSRVRAAPWTPEKALEFVQSRMELTRSRTGAYPTTPRALGLRQSRARLWVFFGNGLPLPPVDYAGGDAPVLPPSCTPRIEVNTFVLCAIASDNHRVWRVDPAHVQQLAE